MEFIDEALLHYSEAHSTAESALLAALNRETHLKVMQSRMLSGHLQGRFLSLLSKLLRPKCILEIGTYTGYSALCLAEGLEKGGVLHTIDNNDERVPLLKRYFDASEYKDQIVIHTGEALSLIPQLEGRFDIVFIDADKENYINYYHQVIDQVSPGGIIITDNVLWSGKVLEEVKANDKDTAIILAYNKLIASDPRVETVLLPLRDGISVARKRETN